MPLNLRRLDHPTSARSCAQSRSCSVTKLPFDIPTSYEQTRETNHNRLDFTTDFGVGRVTESSLGAPSFTKLTSLCSVPSRRASGGGIVFRGAL